MTAPTAAPPLWGLMAEFEGPTEVVEAETAALTTY